MAEEAPGAAQRQAPAAERQREFASGRYARSRLLPGHPMSDLDGFRGHATQARQLARCTTDKRVRTILEILSDELEQKITDIESRQAIDVAKRP